MPKLPRPDDRPSPKREAEGIFTELGLQLWNKTPKRRVVANDRGVIG